MKSLLFAALIAAMPANAAELPIQDCPTCPPMIVLPAGTFVMGSPDTEANRDADEGPATSVTIAKAFAIGRTEVTRGQFAAFVTATGYQAAQQCMVWSGAKLEMTPGKSWRDPGISQTDDHPVVCVSWRDAAAYAAWLSKTTGKNYRLPSNAEWEYAARGNTQSADAFPGGEDDACAYANIADLTAKKAVPAWRAANCDDGVGLGTAKVGSYKPNGYGVYDTVGNVWEWIADCYHPTYDGAPTDGSAWGSAAECGVAFDRGGGFSNLIQGHLRAANRSRAPSPDNPAYSLGFRVARDVTSKD
jgi:formylglycine-generating enzyme required for sulfatase activity